MAKYVKKPIPVEAVEWQPGKEVAGVVEPKSYIVYSVDKSKYYYSRPGCMSTCWLSVEKIPGPASQENIDKSKGFGPFIVQFKSPEGEVYCRWRWDFITWNIKSGDRSVNVDEKDDKFLDYGSVENWADKAEPTAYIDTDTGRAKVKPGDFIITGVKGERYPCDRQIFLDSYDKVED